MPEKDYLSDCRRYAGRCGIHDEDFIQDMVEEVIKQDKYNLFYAYRRALDKRRNYTKIQYHRKHNTRYVSIDNIKITINYEDNSYYNQLVSSLSTVSRMIYIDGNTKKEVHALTGLSRESINKRINCDKDQLRIKFR